MPGSFGYNARLLATPVNAKHLHFRLSRCAAPLVPAQIATKVVYGFGFGVSSLTIPRTGNPVCLVDKDSTPQP